MPWFGSPRTVVPLALLLLVPLAAIGGLRQTSQPDHLLRAPRVATAPVLDGRLGDEEWAAAGTLAVQVSQPVSRSGIGDVTVVLRAAHSRDRFYLAARWPDPTRSVDKARWIRRDGAWVVDPIADEDRLSLTFPIGRVDGFAERGCEVACHGDHMRVLTPGQRIDTWHWKALRTGPAGYADDECWDHTTLAQHPSAGRQPDATAPGSRGYTNNRAADGSGPAYEQAPGLLRWPYLYARDAVPYDPNRPRAEGETIPGILLSRPQGSRSDVDAIAGWRDGHWEVEFARRLNTGHRDDVVFVPGQPQLFSLAVFENLGGELDHGDHGMAEGPFTLLLE